jgi:hypothetical protein
MRARLAPPSHDVATILCEYLSESLRPSLDKMMGHHLVFWGVLLFTLCAVSHTTTSSTSSSIVFLPTGSPHANVIELRVRTIAKHLGSPSVLLDPHAAASHGCFSLLHVFVCVHIPFVILASCMEACPRQNLYFCTCKAVSICTFVRYARPECLESI